MMTAATIQKSVARASRSLAAPARLAASRRNTTLDDWDDIDADEEGSTTVEYAIGTIATAGFAGLLVVLLKSGTVSGLLSGIIETALSI